VQRKEAGSGPAEYLIMCDGIRASINKQSSGDRSIGQVIDSDFSGVDSLSKSIQRAGKIYLLVLVIGVEGKICL
jgi:hypothetical protein